MLTVGPRHTILNGTTWPQGKQGKQAQSLCVSYKATSWLHGEGRESFLAVGGISLGETSGKNFLQYGFSFIEFLESEIISEDWNCNEGIDVNPIHPLPTSLPYIDVYVAKQVSWAGFLVKRTNNY